MVPTSWIYNLHLYFTKLWAFYTLLVWVYGLWRITKWALTNCQSKALGREEMGDQGNFYLYPSHIHTRGLITHRTALGQEHPRPGAHGLTSHNILLTHWLPMASLPAPHTVGQRLARKSIYTWGQVAHLDSGCHICYITLCFVHCMWCVWCRWT